MKRFEEKVVVITGGANGLGKTCVLRFASEGACVASLDVSSEGNQATAAECQELGVEANALHCDITDPDNIYAVFNTR